LELLERNVNRTKTCLIWFNSCYQLYNVLSNLISADCSFYNCAYSVLSQLSRIISNNGGSHKSSIYQNVQACILQVNSTRIGIKLPVDMCVLRKIFIPTRNGPDFKHASQ